MNLGVETVMMFADQLSPTEFQHSLMNLGVETYKPLT